jgi:hypothetical protein
MITQFIPPPELKQGGGKERCIDAGAGQDKPARHKPARPIDQDTGFLYTFSCHSGFQAEACGPLVRQNCVF